MDLVVLATPSTNCESIRRRVIFLHRPLIVLPHRENREMKRPNDKKNNTSEITIATLTHVPLQFCIVVAI